MRQVFHEGDVLRLEVHTHGASIGEAEHITRNTTEVVIEAVGRNAPRTFNDRHTFGSVVRIAVVTGRVPEQDTGGEVIHLVFAKDGSEPTGTLDVKVLSVLPVGTHIHTTVSGIKSKTERIEVGQFGSHANPPGVAMAVNRVITGTSSTHRHQTLSHRGTVLPRTVASIIKAVTANSAIHAPRGHLHAVEGHGHGQANKIHSVAVLLNAVGTRIVVLSTEPEEAGAHVFGELAGDGDTSTVSGTAAEDGAVGDKTGQAEVLKTHTDLGVGLGDHPVNVAVTDLDDLAVGTEGSAVIGLTPVLVAHFEEQNTLQGFGSDDVDLGTQTLFRGEVILAGMLGKSLVTHLPRKRPVALRLDISSLRTSSSAEHEAGSKKQSHDALHVYSFLLK